MGLALHVVLAVVDLRPREGGCLRAEGLVPVAIVPAYGNLGAGPDVGQIAHEGNEVARIIAGHQAPDPAAGYDFDQGIGRAVPANRVGLHIDLIGPQVGDLHRLRASLEEVCETGLLRFARSDSCRRRFRPSHDHPVAGP